MAFRSVFLSVLIIFSVSCSPDDDEQQTIEGSLVFSQGDSAAGITISLYSHISLTAAGVDSVLLPFELSPIMSTILTLVTESPLEETVTGADGAFVLVLPDAAQGILCIHDANYVYSTLDIAALPDFDPLVLNSGLTLTGTYDTAVVIAADTPVRIVGDVIFATTAPLTLEPGVQLTFAGEANLQIEGALSFAGTEETPIALFAHPLSENPLLSVNLISTSPTTISHMILAGPVHIASQLQPLHLNSSLFYETDGIAVNQSLITDSLFIEDCIFLHCDTGVRLADSTPAVIQSNAFLHCARAVHWNSSQGAIRSNYFFRDSLGVLFEGSATAAIEYNHFLHCREDISLYCSLFPTISYNESIDSHDTFLFVRGGARPTVWHNNILSPNDYLVFIYTASSLEGRVMAQENFWHYTDSLLIEDHIRDSLDQHDLLRVDFTGFLFSPVTIDP